jgi:flagellar biosynthetic protein FlhB
MDGDEDDESKTEDPTPKRIESLRKDGVVPRSGDVGAAVALIVGAGVLSWGGARTLALLTGLTRHACMLRGIGEPTISLRLTGGALVEALLPVVIATSVATLVVGVAQTFGFIDFSQAAPKLERLDVFKGLTRVIPTGDTLIETGKTLFKALVLALVAGRRIEAAVPRLCLLANRPPEAAALEVGRLAVEVLVEGMVVLAILAALDWALSYRQWLKRARMTKQEVKDEFKQEDGDPKIKAKRRARAAKIARERAISDVKNATVLVANPTHVSVALRYEPGRDHAPILLAKGLDEVALRMRETARKHKVPIVENRPLARALFANGKVGLPIPVALYESAARVIAHVLRLRGPIQTVPVRATQSQKAVAPRVASREEGRP